MKILIVDGTNQFIRHFTVVPSLNAEGERNGAITGILKTIGYLTRVVMPDKFILCWDGAGGSQNRRQIDPQYKQGRKPAQPRLNTNYEFEQENVRENKIKQRLRLAQYLDDLPITEITIPNVEADDIIAYLCDFYKDEQKVIVSSDQDFYQLLDEKTIMFKPVVKDFYTEKKLVAEHSLYPCNMALVKAIIGDTSDNVAGIRGIGIKNVKKYFPFLTENKQFTLEDVLQFSAQEVETKKGAKYKKFLDNSDKLHNNFKIMQLKKSIISFSSIHTIQELLKEPVSLNTTSFRQKLIIDDINLGDSFFQQIKFLSLKGR